ncbi:MAG: PASTA domain-containing protein, partial [Solirubrobacteraceae bacterium]
MSTSATVPSLERSSKRTDRRLRAATAVGDYVGQSAGHAARAVRRAGLRPGLDRFFGSDPELIGTIVAQEPPAGSELVRNAKVILYVAAPGPPQTQQTIELGVPVEDQAHGDLDRVEPAPRGSTPTHTRTRRARKPRPATGPAAREPSTASLAPAHPASSGGHLAAGRTHQSPLGAFEQATSTPTTARAELGGQLANVFADAGGDLSPWRRAYPRQPVRAVLRRPLRWARSHPALVTVAAAMIGFWIAVAMAGSPAPDGVRDSQRVVYGDPASVSATPASPQPDGRGGKASHREMHAAERTGRSGGVSRKPVGTRPSRKQAARTPNAD